jgi:hypothetical protein
MINPFIYVSCYYICVVFTYEFVLERESKKNNYSAVSLKSRKPRTLTNYHEYLGNYEVIFEIDLNP